MTSKIRVYSDLHQEHQKKSTYPAKFFENRFEISPFKNEQEQTLIIAGDLFYLKDMRDIKQPQYIDYVSELASRFKAVVYVFGNHEFYMSKLGKAYVLKAAEALSHIPNLHILSRHTPSVVIDGVKFVGATLWTDLSYNPSLYHSDRYSSNDFKYITYNESPTRFMKFRPNHWLKEHVADLKWIKQEVANAEHPVVVVSHHAPTSISKDPVDDPEDLYAQFYRSNQDTYIEENPQIAMWIHGHIHYPYDYMMGKTRIFSNPMDYDIHIDSTPERSYIEI